MKYWRFWKYKHLTFLFLSIVIGIIIARNETVTKFIGSLGSAGYIGALIGGMLFVSSFSVGTGAAILIALANTLSPLEIGIFGGLGGVLGDFTIFRFVKDGLIDEVKPIYKKLGGDYLTSMLYKKHFRWILPIVGAFIIASPFPDELGVSLMGISHIETRKFLLISLIFNAIGIFLLVSVFSIF